LRAVIDGKLYRGANEAAGNSVIRCSEENGRLCECGKRGCLMAYRSQRALVGRWNKDTAQTDDAGLNAFREALQAGDKVANTLIEHAGHSIGRKLADLVNITDPEVIVAGGEAVSFGDTFLMPLRAALAKGTFRTAPQLLPDWEDNS
jgi:predicted NBD/HSP70 family sugar kinase